VQGSALAKTFRKRMTHAEVLVWQRLRRRQIVGAYFRRQVPIGPFVADFLCARARLVVEIDGAQHALRRGYDAARTCFLERRGYAVIRFWNHEVFANLDGVVETIAAHLQQPTNFGRRPPPCPPPR